MLAPTGGLRDGILVGIPVNQLRSSKSRLSPVLAPAERARLTISMLRGVVAAVCEGAGIAPVVVTPDPGVLSVARKLGAQGLRQDGTGLNAAVRQLQAAALECRARGLAIFPSDLPHLAAEDVRALLAAVPDEAPAIVLAPDTVRNGTNGLVLVPPDAIETRYGHDSFHVHQSIAAAAGLQIVTVERPGLAHDLDTPVDLATLTGSAVLPTAIGRRSSKPMAPWSEEAV